MNRKLFDFHLKIPLLGRRQKRPTLIPPRIVIQCPSEPHLPFADEDPESQKEVAVNGNGTHVSNGNGTHAPNRKNGIAKAEEFEDLDTPTPLPEKIQKARNSSLRRNSVSLPSGLNEIDLEALLEQRLIESEKVSDSRNDIDSSYSDVANASVDDLNEILTEANSNKKTERNGRRKSVMPAQRPKSPDEESSTLSDEYSPVNSITSINSIASLLREKLQSIPSRIKEKPTDFKIRAFVGFLFLCIVFFVGSAYVMYNQQVLAKAYYSHIKFNNANRVIKIFNTQNVEILRGSLGTMLGQSKAYSCLNNDEKTSDSMCLEWLNGIQLYLYKENTPNGDELDMRCYTIKWQALLDDIHPTDCFDLTGSDHWYGGGQLSNMSWPLEKGIHRFAPFITGDIKKNHWGNALMRYFISSRGVAIIIDNESPLYVSINQNNHKKFCLQARHDHFAYANHLTTYPQLKYKVCTSNDIKRLHSSLSHRSLWDGVTEEDNNVMQTLLSEPVWHIAPLKKHELIESLIYNYTEDVIALGFLKLGHVFINEYWQNQVGDFLLDESRFPTLADTVNIMHRRGFKIVFSIQPFISTESKNFAECVRERLLISERFTDMKIPALTRYKQSQSAAVIDITKNQTVPWLQNRLQAIIDKYDIDGFFVDMGTAHDFPHYYECEKRLINPDEYKTHFITALKSFARIIGVSSTISLPRPPTFVSMPPFESTWDAIKTVIPTILSYGVIGYPFIMPGAIGGDIDWPGGEQFVPGSSKIQPEPPTDIENVLPEKELYIRWLQLATFLPVMKFTYLPSKYNDPQVLDEARKLTTLRNDVVVPLLYKYLGEAMDYGLPLIRPLWMLEHNDTACLTIDDEFSIGEELIVAPILEKKSTLREVYLPSGVWKDGIDGSLRKGSRWIHDYKVPIDKVAHFIKMPDNTRF